MIVRFARAYAKAFFDTAGDTAAASAALDELRRFAQAMEQVPRIAAMAQSPGIPQPVKQETVAQIAETLSLGRLARSLLDLLVENYRLLHLSAIVEAVEELVDRRLGVVKAVVTAADPIDPEQVRRLEDVLGGALGKSVALEVAVAPELLGGFVAQVGSRRYDGSLRGQLDRLAQQLAAAGAVEG
ncbi:MAG TPA: ATP synthase F1 subunit delta [Thermoanaerobaculia bacterium]|nr:ATP synthase F1 subunit delta [Thermoanaerobaculia bacterium]